MSAASADRSDRARCRWWALRLAEGVRADRVDRRRACARCRCWLCAVARARAGAGAAAGDPLSGFATNREVVWCSGQRRRFYRRPRTDSRALSRRHPSRLLCFRPNRQGRAVFACARFVRAASAATNRGRWFSRSGRPMADLSRSSPTADSTSWTSFVANASKSAPSPAIRAAAHGARQAQSSYATTNPPAMSSVPSDGGTPTTVSVSSSTAAIGIWPSFLPEGRRFLYLARSRSGTGGAVFLAEVGSEAQSRELVPSDTQAAYVEPGYLLFGRDARLFRQLFDVRTGEVSGDAVPVVDRLRYYDFAEAWRVLGLEDRLVGLSIRDRYVESIHVGHSQGDSSRHRWVHQDDIALRPCHRMAGAWCIPTSATAT